MVDHNKNFLILNIFLIILTTIFFFILLWYIYSSRVINYLKDKFVCINNFYIKKNINRALKISKVEKVKINGKMECCICLDAGSNKFMKLNCEHLFHEKCIKQWIRQNNSCPICRNTVITILLN